jgi:hypothetical protein
MDHNDKIFYVLPKPNGYARMVNDPLDDTMVNVRIEYNLISKRVEMWSCPNHEINKYEELYVSYGWEYWIHYLDVEDLDINKLLTAYPQIIPSPEYNAYLNGNYRSYLDAKKKFPKGNKTPIFIDLTQDTSTSESEKMENHINWNNHILAYGDSSTESNLSNSNINLEENELISLGSGNHSEEVKEVGFTNSEDFENPNDSLNQNDFWDFQYEPDQIEISENPSKIASQVNLSIDSSTESEESMIAPYVLYRQPDIDYDNFRYKFSDSDSTHAISEGDNESSSEGDSSDISKIFSSEGGIEN